jgi:hypothetical protein
MNEAEVRAVPHMNGFEAQFKKLHRAGWHAVEVNGVAQLYATPELAEVAAYRALMKHIFGDGIVRSGDKASGALTEAEAKFSRLFKGGGKTVAVERR